MTMKVLALFLTLGVGCLEVRQSAAFVTPSHVPNVPKSRGSLPTITTSEVPSSSRPLQLQHPTTTKTTTKLQALPATIAALPLAQKIVLSCLLPTSLGFWKSEYGVSYAYGLSTALTSFWIYKALMVGSKTTPSWAIWQAGALMFYGVRLCIFLLYRELCTQRMKESVERIESKAKERGSRLKRTPFVLSCAGLYFGLCAPLLISSRASNIASVAVVNILKGLVGLTWAGFIFAALGDFNKSIVKAIKGEDHLVTGGIYGFCRHPNYSGEFIGWTANGLIALVAALATQGAGIPTPKLVGFLAASVAGALGLDFVLLGATKGLEKKQKETYGESEDYKKWVESTWTGFELPAEAEEVVDPPVKPEIELDVKEEKGGTGI